MTQVAFITGIFVNLLKLIPSAPERPGDCSPPKNASSLLQDKACNL